jgi:uncharacterized protein (TIRG00374 family)
MKQRLFNFLKLAISLGLLYLLFSRLEDRARLWQQIVNANPWLLLLGASCYATAVALSGFKWGVLLRAIGLALPLRRLLAYQWLAEFFNNFLPAQVGGDVMRGFALAADTQRRADAAASIFIDRFMGLLIFMLSAAVASLAMLFLGRPNGSNFTGETQISVRLVALGSTGAAMLLLLVLAALLSRRLKQLAESVLRRLPLAARTVPIWQKLAAAFNAYRHAYPALLRSALGSLAIVILTSINIWLITQAIAPGGIGVAEVLAINPIIVFIGLFVPFLPGGLGVRQAAFYVTFLLVGRSGDLGIAVGVLQQLIGYLVSLPGAYLWVQGGARSAPRPEGSREGARPLTADPPVEPLLH